MKKTNRDDMRPEYDFSQGERGRYAALYAAGTNIVRLDPEIAEIFPDSQSVNDALRALVRIAQRTRSTPAPTKRKKEVR